MSQTHIPIIDITSLRERSDSESVAKRLHEARGIYHLAASGETSWYEFARAIVELTPNCKTVDIEGIPTVQYPTLARRPAYSALDSSLLHRSFGLCAPHWHVLLAQTLEA